MNKKQTNQPSDNKSRDVQNSNFIYVQFWFGFWKKNLGSVRNEFGLVRFEKLNSVHFGYCSYLLLM